MQRVALYIRVSTDTQAKEGDSIPAQREALRKYAEEHGYVIVGEYVDEGISGRKFKERDELQRMLEDVRKKKIDTILFTKLDRFYRSIRHYTATQETLDKYGVGWLAIWEPIYDTTTPSGRLIVNQMMSIAQFEAENTGARIDQVFAYKVAKGEVISGSTPPGYSIKDKHLVPNADADTVRAMFDYYKRTNNLRQTVLYLEREFGFSRTQANIKGYLSNPIYKGSYRGNQAYCEPIVDAEIFDQVQTMLKANIKSNVKYEYIFTGMCVCENCGRRMANRIAVTARKGKPKYYTKTILCQYGVTYHRCTNKRLFSERVLEKKLFELVMPELQNMVAEYEIGGKKEKKDNKGQIKNLKAKIDRTKELFINGLISLEEVTAKVKQYESDIERLSAVEEQKPVDIEQIKWFLSRDFREIYNDLKPAEKRRVWQSIIKEIRIDSERNVTVIFL